MCRAVRRGLSLALSQALLEGRLNVARAGIPFRSDSLLNCEQSTNSWVRYSGSSERESEREISSHGHLRSITHDVRSIQAGRRLLASEPTCWVGRFPCRGLEAPHSALSLVSSKTRRRVNARRQAAGRTDRGSALSCLVEGLILKSLVLTGAMALTAVPAQAQTCTRDNLKTFIASSRTGDLFDPGGVRRPRQPGHADLAGREVALARHASLQGSELRRTDVTTRRRARYWGNRAFEVVEPSGFLMTIGSRRSK